MPVEIEPSVFRGAVESLGKTLGESAPGKPNLLGKIITNMSSNNSIGGSSGEVVRMMNRDFLAARDSKLSEISKKTISPNFIGPRQEPWQAHRDATIHARDTVGDINGANWIGAIKMVEQEHGPYKAQIYATNLQRMFGDVPFDVPGRPIYETDPTTGQTLIKKTTAQQSWLRQRISADPDLQALAQQGKFHVDAPAGKELRELYGDVTQSFRAGHIIMLPRAAVKHANMFMGMMTNISGQNMLKGINAMFTPSGREAAWQLMQANNVGGEALSKANEDFYRWHSGTMKNYLPGNFGKMLQRNFIAPGLGWVRGTLARGAAVIGEGVVNESVQKLLQDPKDRTALTDLRFLELDPDEVMGYYKANGKINDEHIQRAMYVNVRQKAFTDNPALRNRFQNSASGRFFSYYHTYGQHQRGFLQRAVMQAIETRDPARIASTFAILGLAYPGVGYAAHSLSKALTGRDKPEDTLQKLLHPIDAVTDAKNYGDDMQFLLDQMGLGIAYSQVNSMASHRLLYQMAGPMVNLGLNHLEDFGSGVVGGAEGKKRAFEPFLRDLANDVPVAGSIMAHRLLPTRTEEMAAKPMTSKRIAAQRAAQKRKWKEENQ